jgi:hypothetical protein
VDGYPGKLAVIARRSGDTWYIAGINGEDQLKELNLDLSHWQGQSGYLINDGDEPREFVRSPVTVDGNTTLSLKGHGGFVMVLTRE